MSTFSYRKVTGPHLAIDWREGRIGKKTREETTATVQVRKGGVELRGAGHGKQWMSIPEILGR